MLDTRIQIISDLHAERGACVSLEPEYYRTNADIVIIAGDISDLHNVTSTIERIFPAVYQDGTPGPKDIYIVTGNHEYYGAYLNIDEANTDLKKKCTSFNLRHKGEQKLHFLDNSVEYIEVDNQKIRILGGTVWTDFDLYHNKEKDAPIVARALNDYNYIVGVADKLANRPLYSSSLLTTKEISGRFNKSIKFLKRELKKEFDGPTIVVSHHLPSLKCVAPQYRDDPVSAGFASNLDYLFDGVAVWCCGHTHSSYVDYIDETLIVCNPAGYVNWKGTLENDGFDPKLIVRLDNTNGIWKAVREE